MNIWIWIKAFASAHQIATWIVVSAFVTVVLKKRTPEAYEAFARRNPVWLFSRIAALGSFVAGFGVDPEKVIPAIFKILTGYAAPASFVRLRASLVPVTEGSLLPVVIPPNSDVSKISKEDSNV